MKHVFFLVPFTRNAGLTTVSLGLLHALDKRGIRVGFFKPIAQQNGASPGPERSTHFVRATTGLSPAAPIPFAQAAGMIAAGRPDDLWSLVTRQFHESAGDVDIMVVEGLAATADDPHIAALNADLIRTLGAEIVLVGRAAGADRETLRGPIDFAMRLYAGGDRSRVAGCILNHADPTCAAGRELLPEGPELAGLVPENAALTRCRTRDVAGHLDAEILFAGEIDHRRVKAIHLLARTVPNMMHTFHAGNLLVTPADREDTLLAACMAAIKGTPLAGIVLTGDTPLDGRVFTLCSPGFATGLPVLRVRTNSYDTARRLDAMSPEVPSDDLPRIRAAMEFVSAHINPAWIEDRCRRELERRMSPAAFCHRLTERARAANRRIVLPEGAEPRTIRAAAICAARGIARCVLLGNPAEIQGVAAAHDVRLPAGVKIIDADAVRARYVEPMMELRRHRNLSRQAAEEQLGDDVMLGTMMLAQGEVDGLVSGAVHSSASTVRPALQLIRTKPGVRFVSSVFFMGLPDQVLVYGDCAVIQDPDAETLAEIALQSAASAEAFGIPPRVAMISYSTGESGTGADVEKVRAATRRAKSLRPDLLIDGPLQYDAAAVADVAAQKAPQSPLGGRATVFVFPDLNTGNTTYKAVQRSANVISIGPMLQGLRRPVNDLSRGALVEDIVYTIALTAVQAEQG